jgi:hypothetical protein
MSAKGLHRVYVNLFYKGLLLRGAMVKGKLSFDPRLDTQNYEKKLPSDDTLARAVGLESKFKGARLIIENELANELLRTNRVNDWMTTEGYPRRGRSRCTRSQTRRVIIIATAGLPSSQFSLLSYISDPSLDSL